MVFEKNRSTSGLTKWFLLEAYLHHKEFHDELEYSHDENHAEIINERKMSKKYYEQILIIRIC